MITEPSPTNSSGHTTSQVSPALPVRSVTIDVEEYFHIEAAHGVIDRGDWGSWPSRVRHNIDFLLELFDRHNQRGTFFILGDVARRHPPIAKLISQTGHEVASHGTGHDRLHRLNPDSFRQDLLASKQLLEDQTGGPVLGYRAPTFSVVPQTAWAIDVLVETGFRYDASIFPVRHHWYGVPTAPDRPFWVRSSLTGPTLLEIPPLTWTPRRGPLKGRHIPVAGGGYFRLFPPWLMRQGLSQAAEENRPAVLYFHPWEFDPQTPRMPLPLLRTLRTYIGLQSSRRRLDCIMSQPARWVRLADWLDTWTQAADTIDPFCLNADS